MEGIPISDQHATGDKTMDPREPQRTRGEGPVGRAITLGGVVTAAALMAIAILKNNGSGAASGPHGFEPSLLRSELAAGDPAAIAAAGCIILVLVPLLRLAWIANMLALSKRPVFALLAAGSICVIISSVVIAVFSARS